MTTFDYVLLAIAAVVLVHQLMLMVRAKRDVLIPGTPPNRKAVAVLVAVVLVLAVVRTQNIAQSWPVFVVIAVACVTVFAGGCGLAANGMYSSGRFISFQQAAYYEVDQRNGQTIFRLSRLTRETHMIVPEGKLAAIEELMTTNSIPRDADYQKKRAQSANARAASRQKKKKKKK